MSAVGRFAASRTLKQQAFKTMRSEEQKRTVTQTWSSMGPIGVFVSDVYVCVCVLSWGVLYIFEQKAKRFIQEYEVLVGLGWGGSSSEPVLQP